MLTHCSYSVIFEFHFVQYELVIPLYGLALAKCCGMSLWIFKCKINLNSMQAFEDLCSRLAKALLSTGRQK